MELTNDKIKYDPEKVLYKILQVEKLFPVNEWRINGIEFWPFLRTSLAYTQRDFSHKTKKKKGAGNSKTLAVYIKMILFLPFEIFTLKRKLRSSSRIFIGAVTHRVVIKGLKVNKYFDAAITEFSKRGESSVMLDRGMSLNKSEYPNKNNWFSLPSMYILREVLKRFGISKKQKYVFELNQYSLFYTYLLENFENTKLLKSSFSEAVIKEKMMNFYDRKEIVKLYLKGSKVKNVYLLCYYSSLFYPFIAACNELVINTIDVQHGGMGPGHFSYDRWTQVPVKGYALLPKYFWTWDDNSCRLINRWAQTTRFHKAIKMGTPWVKDLSDFSGYQASQKDYILYNMTDTMLEPYVIAAILRLGKKKTWVLRMHPRQMSKRNSLQDQLAQAGIQNYVSIEDSTQILLNDSLQFCSIFISASSGSVIEAIANGFTPILLPSPGFNYYADYIESGQLIPLNERDEKTLVRLIEDTPPHQFRNGEIVDKKSDHQNSFIDFEKMLAHTDAA